jgi:hypothetical protein
MKIVATYDMTLNLGSGPEHVLRGQEFSAHGTGKMNSREHAASLIGQGAAVLPEAWEKHRGKTEAKRLAAAALVEKAREDSERARRKAAEEEMRRAAAGVAR